MTPPNYDDGCRECGSIAVEDDTGGLCQECDRAYKGLCPGCGDEPRPNRTYCGPCGRRVAAEHRAEVAYDERGL